MVGLSAQPGIFDEAVVDALMENTERPIVFALSNPSELCEANPQRYSRKATGKHSSQLEALSSGWGQAL